MVLETTGENRGLATIPTGREDELFVLRLWDMFDGWITISKPLSKAEAQARWDETTNNGTKNVKYGDGDYYAIYPADTQMLVTPEFLGR